MSRRSDTEFERVIEPDSRYGDISVAKLINLVMLRGKKAGARAIVYHALERLASEVNGPPQEVLNEIIDNLRVGFQLRPVRMGGTTIRSPVEITYYRSRTIAFRWLIEAARSRKGMPMKEKLLAEFRAVLSKTGSAMKTRENMLKMIESNQYSASTKF